ncbi:MAG TPA: sigma-70 family RNA polymerase sigma factor [Gemmataceae bacterium]|nr:sigma-70 family RNA polymerase sigma factor [Gemmataceae bacterium]
MQESPATRVSLLVRLRDGSDAAAWREFVRLYAPVIYGFARKRGLQDADAADLMQEVLRSVSRAAQGLEYDPNRGTFRGWLFTVTRNKVFNFLESRRKRVVGSGDSRVQARLEQHADGDGTLSGDWETDYQRTLAAQAMERVKGEFQSATWQAFLLTAVEGKTPAQIAKQVGLSVGAIYVAKSRVIARLRQEIETMQGDEP